MSALEMRISALPLCRQARLICGPSAGAQIYVFFFSVKLCEKCVLPLSQCLCPCLRSVSFPFCSPQVPGAPPNPIILHVSTGGPRPQAPQTWPGGILPCARTPGARWQPGGTLTQPSGLHLSLSFVPEATVFETVFLMDILKTVTIWGHLS